MLELLVFRHAKAKREPGLADHHRPLTERGRRNAREMGGWLVAEGLVPDCALVSDAVRALQTFESARVAFASRLRMISDPELYHASEGTLLEALQHAPASRRLLLCGHNPGLHDFVTALAGSGDPAALRTLHAGFPTAALAVLTFEIATWREARWRAGHLGRLVTPAILSGDGEDGD